MSLPALAFRGTAPAVRDAIWLRDEMDEIWRRYFADVSRVNPVEIAYHGPWKRRLGVICLADDHETTRIGINSLLAQPDAPYCLTLITIAHELVHYCHGFGSPLPRRYQHPHRGGVVTRELRERGLEGEFDEYSEWIHAHWWSFYARQVGRSRR
jgi:hypothetical protein